MSDQRIRAVLFDLGETLLNFGKFKTYPLVHQGARTSYDFLKSQGRPVGSFQMYFWRNLVSLRLRRLLSSITGRDFDVLALFERVGGKRGITLTRDQWLHFAWLWYEPLSKLARVEPDIKQTLTALRDAGLKLGILSNTFVTSDSLDRQLEQFGLLDLLPVRLYSYQFAFRKPDPRIFDAACRQMDCPPQNTLFVGDRIDADIRPALKMGMHAALKEAYTNAGKTVPDGASRIKTIAELPELIERINARQNTRRHAGAAQKT
jgi:HAD superfamily hydrolase (TIGR01549 family)